MLSKLEKVLYRIIMELFYVMPFCMPAALFSTSDKERLAKEVSTMLSFKHTNVMPLLGVCLDEDTPLLIMPFMTKGSVLEFVKHRTKELLCINALEAEVKSQFLLHYT